MSSIFKTGIGTHYTGIACSAVGRAMPREISAFNASSSNVLPKQEPLFTRGHFPDFVPQFKYDSFGRFFPDALNAFELLCVSLVIALAISAGRMEDNIILAVAAPTPETPSNRMNMSFSGSHKSRKASAHLRERENRYAAFHDPFPKYSE